MCRRRLRGAVLIPRGLPGARRLLPNVEARVANSRRVEPTTHGARAKDRAPTPKVSAGRDVPVARQIVSGLSLSAVDAEPGAGGGVLVSGCRSGTRSLHLQADAFLICAERTPCNFRPLGVVFREKSKTEK